MYFRAIRFDLKSKRGATKIFMFNIFSQIDPSLYDHFFDFIGISAKNLESKTLVFYDFRDSAWLMGEEKWSMLIIIRINLKNDGIFQMYVFISLHISNI